MRSSLKLDLKEVIKTGQKPETSGVKKLSVSFREHPFLILPSSPLQSEPIGPPGEHGPVTQTSGDVSLHPGREEGRRTLKNPASKQKPADFLKKIHQDSERDGTETPLHPVLPLLSLLPSLSLFINLMG